MKKARSMKEKALSIDNPFCGAIMHECGIAGLVAEVNDEMAEKDCVLVATHDELKVIAQYHINLILEHNYDWFLYCQTSCSSLASKNQAIRRLRAISKALGDVEMKSIREKAMAEFSKPLNPRHWDIFLHGTQDQWDEVADEVFYGIKKELDKRKFAEDDALDEGPQQEDSPK